MIITWGQRDNPTTNQVTNTKSSHHLLHFRMYSKFMDFFNLRSPVVTSTLRQRQPDFTSFKHDKSPKCICAVEHLASTRQISQCCTRPGLDSCLYSRYIQYVCVYLNILYIYIYVCVCHVCVCVCDLFI